MKTVSKLTILILTLGLIFCLARVSQSAPIRNAFTYQGHLYDANDVANGLYDFQFRLFDEPCVGSQIGTDVNVPDVDVIDAYFTVELDFGGGVFDSNAVWLEIGVRPGDSSGGYTTLSPRQEVTTTPYALYAETSGNGGGDSDWNIAGNDMYSGVSGNIGIGTTNPANKLSVQGDIGVSSAFYGYKIGSDDVLRIPSYGTTLLGAGAGGAGTGSYNTFSGYRAGYSNTGSYNTFSGHESGYSNTGSHNTFSGYESGRSNITGDKNTYIGSNAGVHNINGSGNVYIGYEAGFNATDSDKLYIANSFSNPPLVYGDFNTGNIGIGTTSPTDKLTVQAGNIKVGSANRGIVFCGGGAEIVGTSGYGIDFQTQTGTSRMTIVDNGNIGIGTTNPTAKLHVAGQVKITGGLPGYGKVLTSDSEGLATWQTASSGDNLGNHTATQNIVLNGHWLSGDGNNEGVYVANNGNVGIGTTIPDERLTVAGTVEATGGVKMPITHYSVTATSSTPVSVVTGVHTFCGLTAVSMQTGDPGTYHYVVVQPNGDGTWTLTARGGSSQANVSGDCYCF
jgi:hypothetical protein